MKANRMIRALVILPILALSIVSRAQKGKVGKQQVNPNEKHAKDYVYYDSLGGYFMGVDDTPNAIANYELAIRLNEVDTNKAISLEKIKKYYQRKLNSFYLNANN